MRLSFLFSKTLKDAPADETSKNAILLMRAGYVDKLTAGVYTYLHLGLRVLTKISNIIREEINAIGGQEILMPALQPKSLWETTNRWDNFDALFKTNSRWGSWEYGLGPTHEEVVVPLMKRFIHSYRDLPLAVYQIQSKFRDEARAKSGILRGREFVMKDLYSFHATEEDRLAYYEKAITAYNNIFKRCGFDQVLMTEASGGSFSKKFSHEFQAITDAGEDTVLYCPSCNWAQNVEISQLKEGDACAKCAKDNLKQATTIEIGNIFDLGEKFSKDFDVTFRDKDDQVKSVIMGCYGIGVSRLFGTLVEQRADERGLNWPVSVAPYTVHLLYIGKKDETRTQAETLYQKLKDAGVEVIYDDRELPAGQKMADADLLGMPVRLLISDRTEGKIEWKRRHEENADVITSEEVLARIASLR